MKEGFCELKECTRDTLNNWMIDSLVEVRYASGKEKESRLFRFLSLYYRSKFPIKGERFELASDVKAYFEDLVCKEALLQIQ